MAFDWLYSTYARVIIGSFIAFLGISLGIYAGFALTGNKMKVLEVPVSQSASSANREMYISPGDNFPDEFYYDSIGNSFDFHELLKDKKTILVFSLWGCGPCTDFIKDFLGKMVHHLQPEIQVVFIEDKNNPDIPPEYVEQASQLKIVFVDMSQWVTTYDLSMWPTIIGVDKESKILHIQFGYPKAIDPRLAEYFFMN